MAARFHAFRDDDVDAGVALADRVFGLSHHGVDDDAALMQLTKTLML